MAREKGLPSVARGTRNANDALEKNETNERSDGRARTSNYSASNIEGVAVRRSSFISTSKDRRGRRRREIRFYESSTQKASVNFGEIQKNMGDSRVAGEPIAQSSHSNNCLWISEKCSVRFSNISWKFTVERSKQTISNVYRVHESSRIFYVLKPAYILWKLVKSLKAFATFRASLASFFSSLSNLWNLLGYVMPHIFKSSEFEIFQNPLHFGFFVCLMESAVLRLSLWLYEVWSSNMCDVFNLWNIKWSKYFRVFIKSI